MSDTKHYDVLRRPVITEKSTLASEHNQVVFEVAPDADKSAIKAAVEALFGVKVAGVNTLNRKGKIRRFRGIKGRRPHSRRAIVTLQEGESIDITTGL